MAKPNLERRLQKNHLALMKHPETGYYSGVMLLGKSEVVDDPSVPTACTDGRDKFYGKKFMESLENEAQERFIQLHENLHVSDKHLIRFRDIIKEDKQIAFAAMDYQINDQIMSLKDKSLCEMPKGQHAGLYEPQFHNWSVREIYRFLRTGNPPPQQNGQQQKQRDPGKKPGSNGGPPDRDDKNGKVTIDGKDYNIIPHDDHDADGMAELTPEQAKEIEKQIDQAVKQGIMIAGLKGMNVPRSLVEAVEPPIDWKAEMADFLTSHIKGNDEYTWRQFDRRRIAHDLYLPSTYSEKINELVVAPDLSGSIGQEQMAEWFGALYAAVMSVMPDRVHILWWDTAVNNHEVYEIGQYEAMLSILKPRGGGGTAVGCVSDYMAKHNLKPDCLLIFSDGYVESDPKWEIDTPTLWLVTENDRFTPPKGQKVKVNLG